MVSRWCKYGGVVGLLTLQIAMAAWAQDVPVHGPAVRPLPAVAGPQDWTRQGGGPQPGTWPPQAMPPRGWAVQGQVPTMGAIPPAVAGPAPAARPAPDPRWGANGYLPGDPQMPPRPIVDPAPLQDWRAVQRAVLVGVVHGRLSNKGRPLVNCQVVIVPLREQNGVSSFDPDRKPLATVTDEQGAYHFDNVPPGNYKLTWLPQGQRQWIRRIAMSPDVKVHAGEVTQLRDIRVALQTIN